MNHYIKGMRPYETETGNYKIACLVYDFDPYDANDNYNDFETFYNAVKEMDAETKLQILYNVFKNSEDPAEIESALFHITSILRREKARKLLEHKAS